jgi:hypothetical protein
LLEVRTRGRIVRPVMKGHTMVSINKKVAGAAVVGAAAAAIGLGMSAGARAADSTPTPSPTGSNQPGRPGQPGSTNPAPGNGGPGRGMGFGHGGRFGLAKGADLSELASKLGVDESKLRDALKAVRDDLRAARKAPGTPSGTPSGTPGKADLSALQDQFAQLLAKELGLDVNTVKTALAEVRAAVAADRQKAFDDRLDQAVKDGKLSQAEADAVKKAAKEGIIGMGRGPR